MTTRSDLRNLCRRRLGDITPPLYFADLLLNQWINDAIADYSLHFPRRVDLELTTAAGQTAYPLPAGSRAVLRVEYPAGEQPPRRLARLSRHDPGFWGAAVYDLARSLAEGEPDQLVLGLAPASGEGLRVRLQADHAWLGHDDDVTTVLDRHLELLAQFVKWKSLEELAALEARNPHPTTLVMGTLELNAYRAERAYRKALEVAREAESESGVVRWRMDRWER